MAKIGFIGLGTMGLPMSINLINGDHTVTGFDKNPDKLSAFQRAGGAVAKSSLECIKQAEFIITMLPQSSDVSEILINKNVTAHSFLPGTIFIDMTTSHPHTTDKLHKHLSKINIEMLDAPVGRTSTMAASGKLLIMVGGTKTTLIKAEPILNLIGSTIVHCGGAGMGSRMKIVNNYMTTVTNLVTAETLNLCKKSGLDIDLALKTMRQTTANNGHIDKSYPARALQNNYDPIFALELAYKDLQIGIDLAEQIGTPTVLGKEASKVYKKGIDKGLGKLDWSYMYELVKG